MRVAVVGYGKMGHEVEAVLRERGHEPVVRRPRRRLPRRLPGGHRLHARRRPWSANVAGRPGRGRPLRRGHDRAGTIATAEVRAPGRAGAGRPRPRRELLPRREPLLPRSSATPPTSWPASPTTTRTSSRSTTARRRTRPRARPRSWPSILGGVGRRAPRAPSRTFDGALPDDAFHVAAVRAGGIVGEHTVGFDSGRRRDPASSTAPARAAASPWAPSSPPSGSRPAPASTPSTPSSTTWSARGAAGVSSGS